MPSPCVDLVEEPEESDDDTKVIFDEEQFLKQRNTAHVTPPSLAYTPPLPCLFAMDPSDTLSMGDEVTLVSTDLECSMPIDTPLLPCIDVPGDEKLDIHLLFGEDLDALLTGIGKLT
uniref:Uncharacterized protein n=1 Tax=Tanacetum cinerariifolium TaxID=118510 RepID=A0A6L2KJE6_TANCI|nr:hypothetical protein [Tanacetum cinerariifolium]